MILSLFRPLVRHSGWGALVGACATVMACSNNSSPPPDAFISGSLDSGQNGPQCPLAGVATGILNIGTNTPNKPTTVQDGGSNGGGNVSVACKVTPNGNNFDIDLSAEQQGTSGATLAVTGTVDPTMGGMNLVGSFSSAQDGSYSSNSCILTYTYGGMAVPVSPYVAAGRIWAHISCPKAQNMAQDVAGKPASCDGEADFLFEQCSQ
jgi:hypothetical protein